MAMLNNQRVGLNKEILNFMMSLISPKGGSSDVFSGPGSVQLGCKEPIVRRRWTYNSYLIHIMGMYKIYGSVSKPIVPLFGSHQNLAGMVNGCVHNPLKIWYFHRY